MVTATDIVRICYAEAGYAEKDNVFDLYSNAVGSRNYTKYAKECADAGLFNGDKQGYDWCAVFVNWVMLQAAKTKEEVMRRLCQDGLCGAGCEQSVDYYKNHNRFFHEPKIGDQIFFEYDGDLSSDHTGYVVGISEDFVYTIEGNSHDKVSKNMYAKGYKYIFGYGRPIYDGEEEESKNEDTSIVKTHVVAPGDTLWDISMKYGCTVEDLVKWNDIRDRSLINVGQVLKLGATKQEEVQHEETPVAKKEYIVQPGDTLWDISLRFQTSVNKLVIDNHIEDKDLIYPGQRLIL